MTSISTGDVQQVGGLRYAQGFLQKVGLGASLFGGHRDAPHVQRNAAEKIQMPIWVQFLLLGKTHFGCERGPRRRSYRMAILFVIKGALTEYYRRLKARSACWIWERMARR